MFWCFQFFFTNVAKSQVAGLNTLTLLKYSTSARSNGLGIGYLPLLDRDITIGIDNPSLINSEMNNTASISVATMFVGGSRGNLAYAYKSHNFGTLVFSFQFNNYGSFEEYTEEDQYVTDFSAADYALSVGWGTWLDSNYSVGVNAKPILSQYESYIAFALDFDVAASFTSDNRRLTATLMARNIGMQVATFDGEREKLPFELSAIVAYKLKNAPFRLYFAANELQRWNLRYEDPLNPTSEVDPFTGEVIEEGTIKSIADNLLRHTVFGIELLIGKSLIARMGYNYRQMAEMRGVDAFNLSAFSFGLSLRTRRFDFAFSHRNYYLSKGINYFSINYKL